MSDKKNITIQDRGWDDMRFILDKELPAKKKKRRFGVWFLFGIVVFTILTITGLVTMLNKSPEARFVNAEVDSIMEISESSEELLNIYNNEIISLEKEKSQSEITNEGVSERVGESRVKNYKPAGSNYAKSLGENYKTSGKYLKNKVLQVISKENKIAEGDRIPENTIRAILLNESIGIDTEKKEGDVLITIPSSNIPTPQKMEEPLIVPVGKKSLELINQNVEGRSMILPFLKLPSSINSSYKVSGENDELTKPIIALSSRNSIKSYLFASGNYQPNINGQGYGAGLGLSYGSEDMHMYLEAGYYKSKFDSGTLSYDFVPNAVVTVLDEKEGSLAIGGELEINNISYDLNVSNFSEITSSIKELKLDLGARKNLFKNFSIDFGMAYSKLLNATNKELEISSDNSGFFPQGSGIIRVESSELYNTGAYSSFDIVPHIGLEYSIKSKLYFSLNYNHGLNNLIANTDLDRVTSILRNEKIYRRNIAVKVRFAF